jgi:Icc-related predicted phosphoesterase
MDTTYTPKVYAVGDIHGCFKTLQQAIKVIGIREEDTLIVCGDVVDRGPNIKDCLDFLLNRPNTEITIGNHDYAFIETVLDPVGFVKWSFMRKQGLNTTLLQLGPEARKYAEALKDKCVHIANYEAPDGKKYVMCHSTWNWHEGEEFNVEHTWERWYEPKENPNLVYANYKGPIIVHGHTPVGRGSEFEEYVNGKLTGINLDGGCCYRQEGVSCLRVMCLTDGKVYEQPNLD